MIELDLQQRRGRRLEVPDDVNEKRVRKQLPQQAYQDRAAHHLGQEPWSSLVAADSLDQWNQPAARPGYPSRREPFLEIAGVPMGEDLVWLHRLGHEPGLAPACGPRQIP